MARSIRVFSFVALALTPLLLGLRQPQDSQPQQPVGTDWYLRLRRPGRPVYMALPDFEVRGQPATEAAVCTVIEAREGLERLGPLDQ